MFIIIIIAVQDTYFSMQSLQWTADDFPPFSSVPQVLLLGWQVMGRLMLRSQCFNTVILVAPNKALLYFKFHKMLQNLWLELCGLSNQPEPFDEQTSTQRHLTGL